MPHRRPWLRRIGWSLLAVVVLVGALAGRYALQRREHFQLREAEAARGPVVSPKRARPVEPSRVSPPSAPSCVRGRVVDHGAPVPGMLVSASASPPAISGDCPCAPTRLACACSTGLELLGAQPRAGLVEAVQSATTDGQGAFELCGVPDARTALVWGEHVDGRLATPPESSVPSSGFVELQVQTLVPLTGVVLSERGPVAGATVLAYSAPPLFVHALKTDARGRFAGRVVPSVSTFVVTGAGLAAQRFEQAATPHQLLVLRVRGAASLTVRVTEAGRPVPGATVLLGDEAPVVTDERGTVAFSLPAARYGVRAMKGELIGAVTVALLDGKPAVVDVALEPGQRVRGVVKDEAGRPLVGARVRGLGGQAPLSSDAQGRFVSEPLRPGSEVYPSASLEGCADAPFGPRVVDAEELVLTLLCAESVSGVVVDAEGKPVGGAMVSLDGAERGERRLTEADGVFRFHLPSGSAQLKVNHPDYRDHAQPLIIPAKDVTVVLDAGGSISGRVVDGKGAGLAAAEVTIVPALLDQLISELESSHTRAVTDADGNFHVSGLRAGRLALSAAAESRGTVVSEVVVLQPGEQRTGLTLVLDERVDLQGTVLDVERRPIAGASVRWDPADEKATFVAVLMDAVRGRVDEVLKYMPLASNSDADGHFELRGLPLSKVKLSVSAPGYGDAEQVASRGDVVTITLERREGRLTGRVVDEAGRPLTRFEVDNNTFTPEDGRFEVRTFSSDHLLFVRAPGFSPVDRTVKMDAPTKDVGDVVLKKALLLEVRVRGADGKPLEGATVRAKQTATGGDTCRTGREGVCALDSLGPEKTKLTVLREGSTPVERELEPAQLVSPLEVTLEVAGGKLTGEVFAVPGRVAVARGVTLSGRTTKTVMTDEQGRFVAEGLPEGRYCVTLEGSFLRGTDWSLPALASPNPTLLQLGPMANGAVVTGRRALPGRLVLARDAAAPLGGRVVNDTSASALCESLQTLVITAPILGEVRVEGVPPGRWAAYVVDVGDADEKADVRPVLLDLLPNETKSLP